MNKLIDKITSPLAVVQDGRIMSGYDNFPKLRDNIQAFLQRLLDEAKAQKADNFLAIIHPYWKTIEPILEYVEHCVLNNIPICESFKWMDLTEGMWIFCNTYLARALTQEHDLKQVEALIIKRILNLKPAHEFASYFFHVAFTSAKPNSNKRSRAADFSEEVSSKKSPPVEVRNTFENLEQDNIEIDEDQNPTIQNVPKNKSPPPPHG